MSLTANAKYVSESASKTNSSRQLTSGPSGSEVQAKTREHLHGDGQIEGPNNRKGKGGPNEGRVTKKGVERWVRQEPKR